MVVLSAPVFNEISEFIQQFRGLTIDLEKALKTKFPEINPTTLDAILAKQWQQQIKHKYPLVQSKATELLNEYEKVARTNPNTRILLDMSTREQYSPIGLCRILLNAKFKEKHKSEVSEMLKNPNVIPDSFLAVNVSTCLYNDNRDGPISDIIRHLIGEEYEVRLKSLATEAGMVFHDENELRRIGYDKTPDLKLAIPCMFRGTIINWIESKASFGDMESHQRYCKDQLTSYANRFGMGIVIYWFGYLDKIAKAKENVGIVIVTDSFPDKSDLIFLDFST